jgi:hypothetical protein
MIDRIRPDGVGAGHQGLVRFWKPARASDLRVLRAAPVAPVDEAEQKPGAEHELSQL